MTWVPFFLLGFMPTPEKLNREPPLLPGAFVLFSFMGYILNLKRRSYGPQPSLDSTYSLSPTFWLWTLFGLPKMENYWIASTSVQPTPSTLLAFAQIMPPCLGSADTIVISLMTWQHSTACPGHCSIPVPLPGLMDFLTASCLVGLIQHQPFYLFSKITWVPLCVGHVLCRGELKNTVLVLKELRL